MRKVSMLLLLWSVPAFAQKVVVSHGPYGSTGPLYSFDVTFPFPFIDSSNAYGMLVNHVKYSNGRLYSVASQVDYIYVHDTSLNLLDSIPTDPGSNLWMGDYTESKAFVSEYLLNRIAAYDLVTKSQIWYTNVNLSPTYVGLYGGYLIAVSSGYDMSSYTSGTSTVYLIDTATGSISDSLRVGINMLTATPWNGDTLLVAGGDYFDASTQKVYILKTSPNLTVVDSVQAPTSIGFISHLSGDTALVVSYSYVGYFVLSSSTFFPFNIGSHVGFSSAVAYGDYVFAPAAEDYTSPGNLLIFERNTGNIVSTQTLSVSPSSVTLVPSSFSVSEMVRSSNAKDYKVEYYDISGRRLSSEPDKGVFFAVSGGKVRKVIKR